MIARAPYLFLLLIIIPDIYFDLHYWRHRYNQPKRLIRWLPTILLTAYTIYLTYEPDFIPEPPFIIYTYLFLLGLIAIPKLLYTICSAAGFLCSKVFHRKGSSHKSRNYGNLLGWCLVLFVWYILLYGSFIGFRKLEVNHQEYHSETLPQAFDGYKIVLFSDAHVGSYTGNRQDILKRAVDSINAQHPDMIVFTGDLQNTHPKELYEHLDILSSLNAKDGVFSVLGNHDYAYYIDGSDAQKVANCRETASLERQMGWTILSNERRSISRGKSQIIIAGMENDGDGKRFPQKGNISKTLDGIKNTEAPFVILLEHDPSAWQRKIIPDKRATLTLSGHTHNAQFSLFGWSPISLIGREVNGWYHEDTQSLFVTAGLGGLIPFRFGATGEIVVLTLHR